MAYIQSAGSSANSGTSLAVAFTSPNRVADCLVVDVIWEAASGSPTLAITDSQGNTWTQIFSVSGSGGFTVTSWVAPNCKAGSNTITATLSTSTFSFCSVAIHEYSGIALTSPIDAYATASTPFETINISITTGHSLDTVHSFGCSSSINPLFISPVSPPFTRVGAVYNPPLNSWSARIAEATNAGMFTFDTPISQTAPATLNMTFTGGGPNVVAMIALKVITIPLASNVNTLFSLAAPWLIVNEPGLGWTDRSSLLDFRSKNKFTNTLQQRGSADVPLRIKATNSYDPTQVQGCQCVLFDQTPAGASMAFAGTIRKVTATWSNNSSNDRKATLNCVSLRQCFDTLLVPPQIFQFMTVAEIFTALFNAVAQGVPVTIGTLNAPLVINTLTLNWDRLSGVFDQLAKAGGYIWDVDLATLSVYMMPPSTTAAPYTLNAKKLLYNSATYQTNQDDYRNRQILRISLNGFAQSSELFTASLPNGGTPLSFTLARPAQAITKAWLTNSTQNAATGSISGNPSNGDTVSIGFPQSGSIYNWAPNAPYAVGQIIVDPANHIQVVETAGTSGGSAPSWNDSGGTTSDGPGSPVQPGFSGGVVWQDQGISGAGGVGAAVYTLVTALDNTQWGQVLIGVSPAQTLLNLQDAINCNALTQGSTFSWPTWENPFINAAGADGTATTFTVKNKPSGALYFCSLAAASPAFSWSAGQTSGGKTGDTYDLQVATNGSSNTANLYYTPGTSVVALASDPTTYKTASLQVQYQRAAGDCIVAENTAQVNLRAALENGTGKYQQIFEDTSIVSTTEGLEYVQQILSAYDEIPTSFSFETFVPGLLPGQLLSISITNPTTLATLINRTFFIQEVSGELIPLGNPGSASRWMNQTTAPGGGHYRFTVTVINESQILSWLAFWAQLVGGGGSGGTLVADAAIPPSQTTAYITPPAYSVPVSGASGTPDLTQSDIQHLTVSADTAVVVPNGLSSGNSASWKLIIDNTDSAQHVITPDSSYSLGSALIIAPGTRTCLILHTTQSGITSLGSIVTGLPITTI